MPESRSAPKIQRWIDLLASLLGRQSAIRFTEIARDVPAYNGKSLASVKRMFERDKRELRALGVPIETVGTEGAEDTAYRLRSTDFYLPYLGVATTRGMRMPRKVDKFGYRALATLAFEPDELRAVAEGAARARQLGSVPLTADAESAVRKLAFDLPVGAVAAPDDTHIVQPRAHADGATLQTLGDALHERRRITFDYHTLGTDTVARRNADPYGLFFLNGHWYLAARDADKNAVRNFRVSRMRRVKRISADKELPDYEIPRTFRLREHAQSRQAWELGDAESIEVVVEFQGQSGAARAAAAMGVGDEDNPRRRRFNVRRPDAFVRWLLSFAGEVQPVSPESITAEFRRQLNETLGLYRASRAATATSSS